MTGVVEVGMKNKEKRKVAQKVFFKSGSEWKTVKWF